VDSLSGDHALVAVRRSRGQVIAVEEAEIRAAEDILRISGICVEPSSAAALACLRALGREGNGLAGKSAVLIATGTGLRWPATFDGISNRPPIVAPSISALRAVIEI
jgi:threonine synthase